MGNEPRIKLRDGWQWHLDNRRTWLAFYEGDRDVEVAWSSKTGCLVSDAAPPDVVLAVIQANAPEVLREFLAGLATPLDIDRDPERWAALHDPMLQAVYAWLDEQQRSTGAAPTAVPFCAMVDALREFRSRVAADCYPEMAVRIAELDDMWAAATAALDQMIGERNAALARIAELERQIATLLKETP